jgi:ubiquinol-cytochrome c reductase cytochrome c1 subunit
MKPTERLKAAALLLLSLATGALTAPAALASGGGDHPYFRVDTSNLAGLQRGARDFMSYCSGCHSMKYLRYNRLAQDRKSTRLNSSHNPASRMPSSA